MKKISIFFALLLVAATALSLVACGDDPHEHTYAEEWTVNETEHYKAATCGCEHEFITKGEHIDEGNDGLCDVCSYDYGHTHTYSDEWTKTGSEHYKAATCGHAISGAEKGAHTDAGNDGLCDVCSYDYGHTHTYSVMWTVTETEHYKAASCGHTVAPSEKGNHVDGNNDKKCDVCDYDYNHTHTYADTLTNTEEGYHYYSVTCGCSVEPKDKEPHADEDGDCACDECGYMVHTYSSEWTVDGDVHYKAASCGKEEHIADRGEHTGTDTNCDCDVCGHMTHTHSDEWTITDKEHYKEASCGNSDHAAEAGYHKDENNDNKCDDCGKQTYNLPSVAW